MAETQSFKLDLTRQTPYRAGQTTSFEAVWGIPACRAICSQGNLSARALACGSTFLLNPLVAALFVYFVSTV
eukprot:1325906-Pyramimonas_sp.AAC.1